jgi:hypothetical protein
VASEIRLVTYKDCDDVALCWRVKVDGRDDSPIPGVLGFMIERQRKKEDGSWGKSEILRNRVGFSKNSSFSAEEGSSFSKPSNIWPFQCYDWTDHGANSGQSVRYQVSAMKLPNGGVPGATTLIPVATTGWSEAIKVDANAGDGISAYFNRGAVMSQYVARVARINEWKARDIKEHIKELEEPLRRFLSGELRLALLRILDKVIEDPSLSIYLALYELSDDELIERLKLLRGRAHIVLANGSDKKGDSNSKARRALNAGGVDVHDRLLGSKGLGHNKFAVIVRTKNRIPLSAWTGSTNWAATGLCTQLNNGILLDNKKIAKIFLDQWDRLDNARNGFPSKLVEENAKSPRREDNVDIWFTRVRNKSTKNKDRGSDLQTLVELVEGANQAILYVMFQPGPEPLTTILKKANSCYVRGVVSAVTKANEETFKLSKISDKEYRTALVQPEGIGKDFSYWVKEVVRSEFLYPFQNPGIGHAITHAKMIVIDPFDDNCKVITGSHNFSGAASEKNDDNFVVVHGNRALAEAYAVACISTYRHYGWRAYVKDKADKNEKAWEHLKDSDIWQKEYLTPQRCAHLAVWCK